MVEDPREQNRTSISNIALQNMFHLNVLKILHRQIVAAAKDTVLCKIIFLLLSVRTSTTGVADVRSLNIGKVDKWRRSFSS